MDEDTENKKGDTSKINLKESIFDLPIGKSFLALITVYSFLLALIALSSSNGWFLFLHFTTLTILIGVGINFINVATSLVFHYNDLIKGKEQEFVSILSIVEIICFLVFSYMVKYVTHELLIVSLVYFFVWLGPLFAFVLLFQLDIFAYYFYTIHDNKPFHNNLYLKLRNKYSKRFLVSMAIVNILMFTVFVAIFKNQGDIITMIDISCSIELMLGIALIYLIFAFDKRKKEQC